MTMLRRTAAVLGAVALTVPAAVFANASTAAAIVEPTWLPCPLVLGVQYTTVRGTSGNDVLDGTAGPDVIYGYAGNDTINGMEGDDIIFGGDGKDTINGDVPYALDDYTAHYDDADCISGGNGADVIDAQYGGDKVYGGDGADTVSAGACEWGQGRETADGGAGVDTLWYDWQGTYTSFATKTKIQGAAAASAPVTASSAGAGVLGVKYCR